VEIFEFREISAVSWIPLRFCRDSQILRKLCGILIPRSQSPRYHQYLRVNFCGIIDTAESISAILLRPRSQALRYHCVRGVRFRGLNDAAELFSFKTPFHSSWVNLRGINDTAQSISAVSMIPRSQSQRYQWYRGVNLSSINDTAESISAVSMIPRSQMEF